MRQRRPRMSLSLHPGYNCRPTHRAAGMEEQSVERPGALAGANEATPVAWRDLREWLALVEARGQLKRIGKPVDPNEELGAVAYLATRREDAPALLFEKIEGDTSGAS